MAETMKAVVQYEHGKDKWELREVPVPEIGDDDVLIEVKFAGVCGSDIAFFDGHHEDILFPPVILGHEFSGVICKVGKNVKKWKVGDRVVSDNTGTVCGECYACSTADYLSCPERLGLGYGMDGGFAKYVKILGKTLATFPNSLMRIPECMSFEEAAVMDPACNGFMAVVQEAKLMPGEYCAVFGLGTLGQFSIQAARAAGAAKIIAIGLSADGDRFEMAKHHGATDLIMSDKVNLHDEIMRITNGQGVAVVADAAGVNPVLMQAIDICRPTGKIVKIGYDARPYGASLDDLVGKAVALNGHFGYDYVSWRCVFNLIEAGKWDNKTIISHKLPLSEWRTAIDLYRNRESMKVLLYPED